MPIDIKPRHKFKEDTFYVITTHGAKCGGNGCRFDDYDDALREAKRRLRTHKTQYKEGLLILKAVTHVRFEDPPIEIIEL